MSKKKTNEEFIIESKQINGDKYDYSLVEYKNNHTKINLICPIHGEFKVRPNDHLSKNVGCNKCNNAGLVKKKNVGRLIIDKFNKKHNFKYNYSMMKYNGTDVKIDIICPSHGVFKQTPKHHLNGHGCKKCCHLYTPTSEEFISEARKVNGDKYDYSLVEYKNNYTKINLICPIHGEFKVRPNDHLNKKSGCPICCESKGERVIRKFLDENRIKFTSQKRFKNCRDIRTLPFDFYLYELNVCIEYDGEQHRLNRSTFGGENRINDIQKKDKIKTDYCIKNNIFLIRISYDEDIINKLKNEICQQQEQLCRDSHKS
jgi:very-short-patch-repair endonuclease